MSFVLYYYQQNSGYNRVSSQAITNGQRQYTHVSLVLQISSVSRRIVTQVALDIAHTV